MTENHGCRFDWCENTADKWEVQRLEHFSPGDWVPATADSLSHKQAVSHDGAQMPAAGVGIRFNEDLDPAPMIWIQCGDADVALRVDEATIFYQHLGATIRRAFADSSLDLSRIISFHSEDRQP